VFFTLNFLATIAFLYFSRQLTVKNTVTTHHVSIIYALTAVFLFRYILLNWDSGQVVILMCCLAAMSLYFFSKGRDWLGAALLAAAILIKYTPVVIIPYLFVRKKYKAAALSMGFIALWLLLPAAYAGWHTNLSFLSSWFPSIIGNSLDKFSYFDYMNQSIYSFILRFTSSSEFNINFLNLSFRASMFIAYCFALFLYILLLLPGRNKENTDRVDYALIFLCIPLFNPNSWVLSYIALALAVMFLMNYLIQENFKDTFVLVSLILAFLLISFWSRTLVGEALEYTAEVSSFITLGTFILFASLCMLKFRKKEPA
jgi:hypothetical protein